MQLFKEVFSTRKRYKNNKKRTRGALAFFFDIVILTLCNVDKTVNHPFIPRWRQIPYNRKEPPAPSHGPLLLFADYPFTTHTLFLSYPTRSSFQN